MNKRLEIFIWSIMLIFMVGYGIALATLWSDYGELAAANIASGDDFLVRDVSDTTLGATGTQKRYAFSSMTTDLSKVLPAVLNSDANGMSQAEMTSAGMYGTLFLATGAGTWNLPGAAAGMNFCLYSTGANAIIINPDDADTITYDGTKDTAGHQIASPEAAGDYICMIAYDATDWYVLGHSGTWVPGS